MAGVLTVPNAVSLLRLLAVPWFWYLVLVADRVAAAGVLILVIGSTDWVDGYLARRLDQVSEVGKVLDPVADRLMIASAVVGGLAVGAVPWVVGVPLVVREAAVAAGTLLLARRGGGTLAVRPAGKVATFLLYGALPSFYLVAAGVEPWLFAPMAWIAGVVGLVLYYWVAGEYLGEIRRRLRVGP